MSDKVNGYMIIAKQYRKKEREKYGIQVKTKKERNKWSLCLNQEKYLKQQS